MPWWSSSESSSTNASTSTSNPVEPATQTPPPSTSSSGKGNDGNGKGKRRSFDELVEEEIPIQRLSVEMEGGMPKCLTLFDNYLLCYSLASQAKSLYRYGHPRDCSAKFEDFKFCMSIKNVSNERREEAWIRRRAEWWAEKRSGRSSEDVWDARRNVYPVEQRE